MITGHSLCFKVFLNVLPRHGCLLPIKAVEMCVSGNITEYNSDVKFKIFLCWRDKAVKTPTTAVMKPNWNCVF